MPGPEDAWNGYGSEVHRKYGSVRGKRAGEEPCRVKKEVNRHGKELRGTLQWVTGI